MFISAIDDSLMPDRTPLLHALRGQFGEDFVRLIDTRTPGITSEFQITVRPSGSSSFSLIKLDEGTIAVDGTEAQNAVVAALVRGLLPVSAPRIVAVEAERNAYVDLVPGITADAVAGGWRDVSEGGF